MNSKSTVHLFFYLIVIVFVGLFLEGCKKREVKENEKTDLVISNQIIDKEINHISVLYYNYIYENDVLTKVGDMKLQIPDFSITNKGILDAEITDSVKLSKIKVLVDNLQDADIQNLSDARIFASIRYNDGEKDTLIISGKYSDQIFVNGVEKICNNELLFLLKNYIGFYPWMIGDDMFSLKELKDTSFAKEPFFSNNYYKEYQTALSQK